MMRRSPFRTQVVALGILVVASVLGNVAASASRNRTEASVAASAVTVIDASESDLVAPSGSAQSVQRRTVNDRDEVPNSRPNDEGQIVPAIYSWDPDITFVFYRHVTKWM